MKKIIAIIVITLSFSFILAPNLVKAEKKPVKFKPQVTIPGSHNFIKGATTTLSNDTSAIALLIKDWYNYILGTIGILATIVLMISGLLWATSAGDASKITKAKEMMTGSISGLILFALIYLILNTINPDLVKFRTTLLPSVDEMTIGCCIAKNKDKVNTAVALTQSACENKEGPEKGHGKFTPNAMANTVTNKCDELICCNDNLIFVSSRQQCTKRFSNPTIQDLDICKKSTTMDNYSECSPHHGPGVNPRTNKYGGDVKAFCYNGMIYSGNGELHEPCGNEGGSICTKKNKCNNTDIIGPTENGRGCGSGLTCCENKGILR